MANTDGWHSRGYLPHFDLPQLTQFVTFRLSDSLPPPLRRSRDDVGKCILSNPAIATLVEQILLRFHHISYNLHSWVIMPNHVHALITVHEGWKLSSLVQSWKSCSARLINKELHRTGAVWYPDYFDRYIRSADHFDETVAYIEENPVRAGLVSRKEEWRFSSGFKG